jgi:hypothetical protein
MKLMGIKGTLLFMFHCGLWQLLETGGSANCFEGSEEVQALKNNQT